MNLIWLLTSVEDSAHDRDIASDYKSSCERWNLWRMDQCPQYGPSYGNTLPWPSSRVEPQRLLDIIHLSDPDGASFLWQDHKAQTSPPQLKES